MPVYGSPRLFAVSHVLHRHFAPRHPPLTLSSFRDYGEHDVLSVFFVIFCLIINSAIYESDVTDLAYILSIQLVMFRWPRDHGLSRPSPLTGAEQPSLLQSGAFSSGQLLYSFVRETIRPGFLYRVVLLPLRQSSFFVQFSLVATVTKLSSVSRLLFRLSGDEGTRTPGICLAKAALSQLSYIPSSLGKWAFQDSNLRPLPYQRNALTS